MFTIHIGSFSWPIHWYGVILMTATVIAAWLAEREVRRRGENGDHIWNAAVWLIPAGVIGARLWFVVNATLGGNLLYVDQPLQILNIPAGGLHIYGGLLFGGIALFLYARRYELDLWLLLDSIAPTVLIGQALARPANFINQELYGQPTTLPWGIPISADHRIAAYSDLVPLSCCNDSFPPDLCLRNDLELSRRGFVVLASLSLRIADQAGRDVCWMADLRRNRTLHH